MKPGTMEFHAPWREIEEQVTRLRELINSTISHGQFSNGGLTGLRFRLTSFWTGQIIRGNRKEDGKHIHIFIMEMIGTVAFRHPPGPWWPSKGAGPLGRGGAGCAPPWARDAGTLSWGTCRRAVFLNPVYVIAGFLTVIALFTVVRLNQRILESRSIEMYERVMNIFDAIGLGGFHGDRDQHRGAGRIWGLPVPGGVSRSADRRGRRRAAGHHGRGRRRTYCANTSTPARPSSGPSSPPTC